MNNLKLFLFFLVSIPIVIIDIRHYKVPDRIVIPGIIAAAVLAFLLPDENILIFFGETLIGFIFFLTVRILTNGNLGFGDVKYSVFLAGILGFTGWLIAVFTASITGFVFFLPMLISGKMKKTDPLPFVPFLAIGGVIAFLIINTWFY